MRAYNGAFRAENGGIFYLQSFLGIIPDIINAVAFVCLGCPRYLFGRFGRIVRRISEARIVQHIGIVFAVSVFESGFVQQDRDCPGDDKTVVVVQVFGVFRPVLMRRLIEISSQDDGVAGIAVLLGLLDELLDGIVAL